MVKKETAAKKPASAKAPAGRPAIHSPRSHSDAAGHVVAKHPAQHVAPVHHGAPAHPATHAGRVRYFEGIGRRKTAVARVRLEKGTGKLIINGRTLNDYFQADRLRQVAEEPLKRLGNGGEVNVSVKIEGGGINAQAEAVRHGISRALVMMKPDTKLQLASLGLLTRDSRMVERKHYGLRKARRAPQWKKR